MKPKALTAADLAKLVNLHPNTIRSRASRGESLPTILRRNPLMFDASESAAWARDHLDWMNVEQAAERIGMAADEVRKHIAAAGRPRKIPPHTKRGRAWAFRSRDVAAFLRAKKGASK